MDYIDEFVKLNALRPADAIVVKKDILGVLGHYAIFLGVYNEDYVFIANAPGGVQVLNRHDLNRYLQLYSPRRINRFIGNENQRSEAVNRAISRTDENAYHLILNNCQHYAEFVQEGVAKSQQVRNFGAGLTVAGAIVGGIGVSKGNQAAAYGGLGLMGLGLLTLLIDNINEDE